MTEISDLTDKRRVFVEEYLCCWNGTEAARRAEYAYPRREASRLLSNVDIRALIEERVAEKAMSADEALAHLADIARFDIGRVVGKGGVIDLDAAKEADQTRHLKRLEWTPQGIKLEAYDKLEALEKIGKAHGLYIERRDITSGGESIKGYVTISPDDWPEPDE